MKVARGHRTGVGTTWKLTNSFKTCVQDYSGRRQHDSRVFDVLNSISTHDTQVAGCYENRSSKIDGTKDPGPGCSSSTPWPADPNAAQARALGVAYYFNGATEPALSPEDHHDLRILSAIFRQE
ncbi:hypothetical protein LIA77_02940 [Sarocladium implicatum]|nr:hypothetical protein LIA77_02940 [Sarocladium implicatum]